MTYDLWAAEILRFKFGVGRKNKTETLSLINTDTRKQLYKIVSAPGLALKGQSHAFQKPYSLIPCSKDAYRLLVLGSLCFLVPALLSGAAPPSATLLARDQLFLHHFKDRDYEGNIYVHKPSSIATLTYCMTHLSYLFLGCSRHHVKDPPSKKKHLEPFSTVSWEDQLTLILHFFMHEIEKILHLGG